MLKHALARSRQEGVRLALRENIRRRKANWHVERFGTGGQAASGTNARGSGGSFCGGGKGRIRAVVIGAGADDEADVVAIYQAVAIEVAIEPAMRGGGFAVIA